MPVVKLRYSDYGSLLYKECGIAAIGVEGGAIQVYYPDERPTEEFRSWESVIAATQAFLPARLNMEIRP